MALYRRWMYRYVWHNNYGSLTIACSQSISFTACEAAQNRLPACGQAFQPVNQFALPITATRSTVSTDTGRSRNGPYEKQSPVVGAVSGTARACGSLHGESQDPQNTAAPGQGRALTPSGRSWTLLPQGVDLGGAKFATVRVATPHSLLDFLKRWMNFSQDRAASPRRSIRQSAGALASASRQSPSSSATVSSPDPASSAAAFHPIPRALWPAPRADQSNPCPPTGRARRASPLSPGPADGAEHRRAPSAFRLAFAPPAWFPPSARQSASAVASALPANT